VGWEGERVVVCDVMVGVGRVGFGLYHSYQEDGLICNYEMREGRLHELHVCLG
jgi:hypothetical protein